jgi:hypothetical protein
MQEHTRSEFSRQIAYVVLGCVLAYAATWIVNQFYHLGGAFGRLEQINPLFVQTVEPIPSDAIKFFSWESDNFGQAATLLVSNNSVTLEEVQGGRPRRTSQYFLRPLPKTGCQVFVENSIGRGFVTIAEQPTPKNDYTTKVRIEDPYGSGSEYKLNLYFQPVEGQ